MSFAVFGLMSLTRASKRVHNSMVSCVMRSPMSFFDTTPIGRILNRFASDVDVLDDRLPRTYRQIFITTLNCLGVLTVIVVNTPIFMAAVVPLSIIYVFILVSTIVMVFRLCFMFHYSLFKIRIMNNEQFIIHNSNLE